MRRAPRSLALLSLVACVACGRSGEPFASWDPFGNIRRCARQAARLAVADPEAGWTKALACDTLRGSDATSREPSEYRFKLILAEQKKLGMLVKAALLLNDKTRGPDGLASAMAVVAFDVGDAAPVDARRIKETGDLLGSGEQVLGNLIQIATTLARVGPLDPENPRATVEALSRCTGACAATVNVALGDLRTGACASASNRESTDPQNFCRRTKEFYDQQRAAADNVAAFAAYLGRAR